MGLKRFGNSRKMDGRMKFEWHYRYVKEGVMEDDKHGRWAIDGYMFTKHNPKSLPIVDKNGYLPLKIATIYKGGRHDRFTCDIPCFDNNGLSNNNNLYSNTIEDLKKQIQERFEFMYNIFKKSQHE